MGSPIIRRRFRRRDGGRNRKPWLRLLIAGLATLTITAGALLLAGAVAILAAYNHLSRDLPAPEQIEELTLTKFETTKIYDRTGQHLLYEVRDPKGGDRTMISLKDIPVNMRQATVALEDKTFYTNPAGINIEGIVRAAWNNLQGKPIQGGSSITAQLVRNVAMTPEERATVSYERKFKEAILSYELTRRYPGLEGRDRILEWYLNTVFYGHHAYGVEAAAKAYFGKHARDLSLAESAMLAGIPQSPGRNPIDNPWAAKARQSVVLDLIAEEGYITPEQAQAAKQAELGKPAAQDRLQIEAPHFVMYLLNVMEERYGKRAVYGGGLRVITTLDFELQQQVQQIVTNTVRSWPASSNARNAAAVAIRPSTGEILAMVGSVDYFDESISGEVNMAFEPRQPGSSFKPYTYAAAFEQGYNPGTQVVDERTAFPVRGTAPFVPANFDGSTHGAIPLRQALGCSYNIPAVILLDRIGIDSAVEMAHRLGIGTLRDPRQYVLPLTLGAGELRLVDHTFGFSVFANGGTMAGIPVPPQRREPGYPELDPVAILSVTDVRGKVIEEFLGPTTRQLLSPQVAYQVASVLSDNAARTPAFGPVNALMCSRPAAAKTGTTNDNRDCWTVGFNPQLAVGIWVGNADRTPMGGWYGAIAAAPIWHDIMEYAFKSLPPVDFVEPPGVKWVEVDAATGAKPKSGSKKIRDVLVEGWEPTSADKVRRDFAICRASGKMATQYCPPDEIEHKTFEVYPTANGEWVRNIKGPQPPTRKCDVHGPNAPTAGAPLALTGIGWSAEGWVPASGACAWLDLGRQDP